MAFALSVPGICRAHGDGSLSKGVDMAFPSAPAKAIKPGRFCGLHYTKGSINEKFDTASGRRANGHPDHAITHPLAALLTAAEMYGRDAVVNLGSTPVQPTAGSFVTCCYAAGSLRYAVSSLVGEAA